MDIQACKFTFGCQCLPGYYRIGSKCVLWHQCYNLDDPKPERPTCAVNEKFFTAEELKGKPCEKTVDDKGEVGKYEQKYCIYLALSL